MDDQYKALTVLHLPFLNDGDGERISPGGTVTREQLEEARQSEEDVQALIDGGSISADSDASINPAHFPVTADRYGEPIVYHPDTGEQVDPQSITGDSVKPEDASRPWARKGVSDA